MSRKASRRQFLSGFGAAAAGAAIAACQPKTVIVEKEVETEVTRVVKETVKETVVVEGTPKVIEKEVTKIVKETVEVEAAPETPESMLVAAGVQLPGSPDHPRGWKTSLPDLPKGYPLSELIVITTSRRFGSNTEFAEGDDLENNHWTRMIRELFGIQFKVAWTWATGDEALNKYNMAAASGDLPDLMEDVPIDIYYNMAEEGQLLEIGPIWDEYASYRWREGFNRWGDLPWVRFRVDGKRYGLPRCAVAGQDNPLMWMRKDWLDKLGLSVPTTLDEVHDVALAFVEDDIGAGAPGTTVGLLANNQFRHTWFGALSPIWTGHGLRVSGSRFGWSETAKGDGLQYDGIRPDAKEGLAMLRQWYADGIIREDFYTLGPADTKQDIFAGNCGLYFSPFFGVYQDIYDNNPGTEMIVAEVPPGPKCHCIRGAGGFGGPMACRKEFQYAKEWIEMNNWWIELKEDPRRRMHGWEGVNYEFDQSGKYAPLFELWHAWIPGPIGTRGGGNSSPDVYGRTAKYQIEEWGKIPPAERDAYQEYLFADPIGVRRQEAYVLMTEGKATKLLDEFNGQPTPAMEENQAYLSTLEDETFLGIITGERPVDVFDDFVTQWKKLGGDQITEEVSEWWRRNQ